MVLKPHLYEWLTYNKNLQRWQDPLLERYFRCPITWLEFHSVDSRRFRISNFSIIFTVLQTSSHKVGTMDLTVLHTEAIDSDGLTIAPTWRFPTRCRRSVIRRSLPDYNKGRLPQVPSDSRMKSLSPTVVFVFYKIGRQAETQNPESPKTPKTLSGWVI